MLYSPAGGIVELAGFRVRQVVGGDGRGGCVKHGCGGEGQGDPFEHGSYLLFDRCHFIITFFSRIFGAEDRWRGIMLGRKGAFVLEQEKQPLIINIQCVTGTGLLYQDVKHIIKCLVKLTGHLIWSVISTIWLCYSEWWDSLHTPQND